MQMAVRRAAERGHADHGWLDTNHTFSFAGYYDERFMGFSHLRVINEDRVAPGRGFPTHPHRNMEIITFVVDGALEHKDTLGTGSVIRPGEIQVMSAGSGIAHSEYNHSSTEPVHFLQIWILPSEGGGKARYEQRAYEVDTRGAQLIVSPDGREGSVSIKQDMALYRVRLDAGQTLELELDRPRAWAQVVRGSAAVNGAVLQTSDGLAVVDRRKPLSIQADEDVELLVFDLV